MRNLRGLVSSMERRRTSAGLMQTSCPVDIPRGGVRTPPEISSARDSETAAAVSVSSTITLFLTPKVLILPTSLSHSHLTFESRVSLDCWLCVYKGGESTAENCQILQTRVNRFKSAQENVDPETLKGYSCDLQFTGMFVYLWLHWFCSIVSYM